MFIPISSCTRSELNLFACSTPKSKSTGNKRFEALEKELEKKGVKFPEVSNSRPLTDDEQLAAAQQKEDRTKAIVAGGEGGDEAAVLRARSRMK